MIVKKTILRLLGSSDDNEKIGIARPEGPPLRGFRCRDNLLSPVKPTLGKLYSSVHWNQKAETRVLRRITDDA